MTAANALATPRPDWFDDAACRDTDPALFYPERGEVAGRGRSSSDSGAALACFGCPVRADCLEYAMETGEKHGMWGGLSPKARRGNNGRKVLASLRVVAA